MDCEELRELSKQLREGAAADIWYDADTFGDECDECDENYQTQIETAQHAMTSAADFLDRLAELIE